MKNKAVFLDRDGTIIKDAHYLKSKEQIQWLPGAMEALDTLKKLGYVLLILTNQSGVARGYFTEDDVNMIHDELESQLYKKMGIRLDGFYYCPHHSEGLVSRYALNCNCRKPKNGLFRQAISDWDIDVKNSIAIGDGIRDLEAAFSVGVSKLILYGAKEYNEVESDNNIKYTLLNNWKDISNYLY